MPPTQPEAVPSLRSPRRISLLAIAVGLFGVGLVAIVAIFGLPVVTGHSPGIALYLTTLCTPAGLLVAIVFALRSGRRSRNKL